MLRIRAEQLQPFSEALLADFLQRMSRMLAAEFPSSHGRSSQTQRLEYARAAYHEASRWQIEGSEDVEDFTRLCAARGQNLKSTPVDWGDGLPVLADTSLTPALKIQLLREQLPEPFPESTHRL